MIKKLLTTLVSNLRSAVRLSPLEIAVSIFFFVISVLLTAGVISDEGPTYKFLASFPICFAVIYSMNMIFGEHRRWAYWASVAIVPLMYLARINVESYPYWIAIAASFVLMFAANGQRNNNQLFVSNSLTTFADVFVSLIFSSIAWGLLVMTKMSILYIFDIQRSVLNHFEEYTASGCFLILFPLLFITFNRNRSRNFVIQAGNAFDILINYIITPILIVYGVILYIYFAKILFAWTLPEGVVSATAIGFIVGGLILKMARLVQSRPRFELLFKYFSLWAVPAVIMMWIGTLYRISEYGFTVERVYLLITVVAMTLWLIGVACKKHTNYFLLTTATAVVYLLFTFVPPMSAEQIELRSQKGRPQTEKIAYSQVSIYFSRVTSPINIDQYKSFVPLVYSYKTKDSWYYENDDDFFRIYDDKGVVRFDMKADELFQLQIQRAGIKLDTPQDSLDTYSNKMMVYQDQNFTIIFDNLSGYRTDSTFTSNFISPSCILLK